MQQKLDKTQQALVVEHIDYSKRIAQSLFRDHGRAGIDYDDFEGAAYLGLCDAALRFEPSRGLSFKSFSYLRIRGSVIDLMRKMGIVPRALLEKEETSIVPRSAKEVASVCNSMSDTGITVHLGRDQQVSDLSYADMLSPEEKVVSKDSQTFVVRLLHKLPAKERKLLELRYFEGYTLENLRSHFGRYSRSWVSRLQTNALDALRVSNFRAERSAEQALANYATLQ